jgi:hypothetical protein
LLAFLGLTARAAEPAQQSLAAPVYDAQSFSEELDRLDAALDTARGSAGLLHSYHESLPKAWAVTIGGQRYDVPTDPLTSRIRKAESAPELRRQQVDQAKEFLKALAGEAALLAVQPPPPMNSAEAKLDAILARPEYSRVRQQSWWDRIRERIGEILLDAWDRLFGHLGSPASLGRALLWLGICGAALLIAWWIFRLWFRAARMDELAVQAAAIPLRSWQEWVFASREASARGDYRLAIHCAYWAGIARLQDLGALSPDRAKTPREFLRALTQSKLVLPETLASRQQALSLLTSRLEKTWYGYSTATEPEFRDCLIQLETLGCHLP